MKKIKYINFTKPKNRLTMLCFVIATISCSCTRKLDVKPDQSLIVPSSPQDLQAELDNAIMYQTYPSLGEVGTDSYYEISTNYNAYEADAQAMYIWAKQLYTAGDDIGDWDYAFSRILYANLAMEGLETMSAYKNTDAYNNVKGSALFYRAFNNFCLAQIFCKPYIASSASTDLGIPLSLHSDILVAPKRVSVLETYQQIINDLKEARPLLPNTTTYKTRPSKLVVDALLSRIYLSMGDYTDALSACKSVLETYNALIDYNTLNPATAYPFTAFNDEVLFYTELSTQNSGGSGLFFFKNKTCAVDSNLYRSYQSNDLRKTLFFTTQSTGLITWRGNYTGQRTLFGGLSTDEMVLIKAECEARNGDANNAMNDLNVLLKNRLTGTFIPLSASNADDALSKVLTERRKELLFRGLRWTDLRRLNQDPNFATTLTRNINGQVYTLPPNSQLYVYPIPPNEIAISGMQQNER